MVTDDRGLAETLRYLARQRLKPSRYQVLLAIITSNHTAIADLAEITGLSQRSVKGAVSELRTKGLVERVEGRCGRLLVTLPPEPPDHNQDAFTRRQRAAVGRLLRRASKLLSTDARDLPLPSAVALGLPEHYTLGAAYEALLLDSTRRQRHAFVKAVIDFVQSEQVSGHRL